MVGHAPLDIKGKPWVLYIQKTILSRKFVSIYTRDRRHSLFPSIFQIVYAEKQNF